MIIGVDIDEVVAEYLQTANKYLRQYGIKVTQKNYKTYDFVDTWKVPKERFDKIFQSWIQSEQYDQIKPVRGAITALTVLAKKHKIVFITSRNYRVEEKTKRWLAKHFDIPYKLRFSHNRMNKDKKPTKDVICKQEGVQVMIEDQIDFAQMCAAAKIKVFLFNKVWNRTMPQTRCITRVQKWTEILTALKSPRN